MKNRKELIIDRFRKVKELGFVESHRKNNTGIGKTFEDYIGVVENNIDEPDLFGYEIKAHRNSVGSYITLFTKSPDFPKGANSILKDRYGVPYDDIPELKKLHTSMFADRGNTFNNRLSFRLINDRENKVLKIGIFDLGTGRLIDSSTGYTYNCLNKILHKKLIDLFYVSAERKYDEDKECFHFNQATIYSKPSLERFLSLVDKGLIMYDIRIGSYKSGKSMGKAHDHGSGFRILEGNLRLLFDEKENVQ